MERRNLKVLIHFYMILSEMHELQQGPVLFENTPRPVDLKISCFICDTPARAFVKQVKGHSDYYGCDKCVQKGSWDKKVIFPDEDSPLRTDIAFDEMRYVDHCTGQSPLQALSVGMVSQFPLDYMHLVCLGVMRRLLWVWTHSPFSAGLRLHPRDIQCINDKLSLFKDYIPREFSRKCRSLVELDRWKAIEFRQFLLYTGIFALKDCFPRLHYKHFLLLFGIFCLASPELYLSYTDYAHDLLCLFVQQARELYGREILVYNVHGLCHIAADVRLYGPLDGYSAFPFENFLAQLKRLVRKPQHPLQQVVRRLYEQVQSGSSLFSNRKETCFANADPKRIHFNGPVPEGFDLCNHTQYQQIYHQGLFFSITDNSNKCVKIAGSHFLI